MVIKFKTQPKRVPTVLLTFFGLASLTRCTAANKCHFSVSQPHDHHCNYFHQTNCGTCSNSESTVFVRQADGDRLYLAVKFSEKISFQAWGKNVCKCSKTSTSGTCVPSTMDLWYCYSLAFLGSCWHCRKYIADACSWKCGHQLTHTCTRSHEIGFLNFIQCNLVYFTDN